MKQQKIKAHCVQCNRELVGTVDSPGLQGTLFVCTFPDCPNYGLVAICKEKMKEFEKK